MIQLGMRAKDRVTGLEGIVIARTEWLYGCTRITIQPEKRNDGTHVDSITIDEPQGIVLNPNTEFTKEKVTEETPPGEGVG